MLKRHFGTNLEPFLAQAVQVIKIIHFGTRLKSFLGQAAQTGVDQKQSEGLVKRLAIPSDMHLTRPSEGLWKSGLLTNPSEGLLKFA